MPEDDIRSQRTADLVARRITRAILAGELAPGDRLREETLATSYDVSRTPIREALIQLSATGLVDLKPNRGATVLALTVDDILEVYHLRAVLEGEAANMAARTITAETLVLLEKSCDRLGELHEASPIVQLAADIEFHYRIAEASGSSRLATLIRQVSAVPEAYRSTIAYTSDHMREAERQHRAVASELGRHRAAAASRLMRAHVHWAGRLAAERLEGGLSQ